MTFCDFKRKKKGGGLSLSQPLQAILCCCSSYLFLLICQCGGCLVLGTGAHRWPAGRRGVGRDGRPGGRRLFTNHRV